MCGVLDLAKMDCENGECLWYLQGMLIDEVCLLSGLVSGFLKGDQENKLKRSFPGYPFGWGILFPGIVKEKHPNHNR